MPPTPMQWNLSSKPRSDDNRDRQAGRVASSRQTETETKTETETARQREGGGEGEREGERRRGRERERETERDFSRPEFAICETGRAIHSTIPGQRIWFG